MTSVISRLVVLSRWALVPLFLGLGVALVLLVVAFCLQLWGLLVHLVTASETEVLIALLSLIDLTLVGGLMVIVICSGYENFVGRIEASRTKGWPAWMMRVNFSVLKQKLFASMMAIAGVTLLKALMKLEVSVSETQVKWLAVANIILAVSYVVLTVSDRFGHHAAADDEDGP